ncbi:MULTISPECIES: hypothetical protein [Mycolicibacter]|uniref:Secreted protein n=1 Tax=Mycolicibacter kumamotonensis TaxID=354243 RepID=A0A7K3LCG4_9MYCO|nr:MULTISPECIES: hypothetical protein [Mycolicibacter]NDJ90058.1 hypothetical protein [Mycolicibacter kumamotonensis]
MLRRLATAALATALLGIGVPATATAAPGSDGSEEASCAFTLSPPYRAQVSGVDVVTATVTVFPCTGSSVPGVATACVQLQGSDAAPVCAQQYSKVGPAQPYLTPYVPGTYVSTGKGCTNLVGATSPGAQCQALGPSTAAL